MDDREPQHDRGENGCDHSGVPARCPCCGARTGLDEDISPARGGIGPDERWTGGPGRDAASRAGSGLAGLDPVELLEAAGALVAAAQRLSLLVGDAEWFVAPWRVAGGDEYSDLRAHVDATGREARAAARVLYLIGQNAVTNHP